MEPERLELWPEADPRKGWQGPQLRDPWPSTAAPAADSGLESRSACFFAPCAGVCGWLRVGGR